MKNFFGWLSKKLLHNGLLKLASIFLAFVIWFIVAQVGDPKDTRSYNNIPVRLINTNLLTNQNKCYSVMDGTDVVKVNVTAPTSVFQTLRPSDIVAEADISKLTDINTIAITYYALNTTVDAISFEGDHEVVRLDVENKISKWIRLQYQTVGTVAEGYVIGSTSADQTSISISGPESVVNQVYGAYAELNVEGATNNSSANVEIVLRDRENNVLDQSRLEMSADHVLLSAEILTTKEVSITVDYSGTPAEGYVVVGKPEQDVTRVLLAGTVANLSRISRINVPGEKVDVTGAQENVEITLNVKDFLPDNVKLADPEFNGKIKVNVTIKAARERSMEIPAQNVTFVNVPEGYKVELPEEESERLPVALKVYGLRDAVNALRVNNVTGTVDVSAWMSQNGITQLEPGRIELPVTFTVASDIEILESGTVRVEITAIE